VTSGPRAAADIIPAQLAEALRDLPRWFVIGGQAVRCFAPYRPSRDVDFGVGAPADLDALLGQLTRRGQVEVLERSADTVHARWNGLKLSIFVLDRLLPFVAAHQLTAAGLLANKLHAILGRGTRRDFFDLYVLLQLQRLGLAECLRAFRAVFGTGADDGLLLRALTYFDDAEREAPLPGEGRNDWKLVKAFFVERAGSLLVPPARALEIQSREVDVAQPAAPLRPARRSRRPGSGRRR
jgi:hypothetical protein